MYHILVGLRLTTVDKVINYSISYLWWLILLKNSRSSQSHVRRYNICEMRPDAARRAHPCGYGQASWRLPATGPRRRRARRTLRFGSSCAPRSRLWLCLLGVSSASGARPKCRRRRQPAVPHANHDLVPCSPLRRPAFYWQPARRTRGAQAPRRCVAVALRRLQGHGHPRLPDCAGAARSALVLVAPMPTALESVRACGNWLIASATIASCSCSSAVPSADEPPRGTPRFAPTAQARW